MIDKINYGDGPDVGRPGADRLSCPDPGAPYRISNFKAGTERYKDFTVKPGRPLTWAIS